MKNYILLLIVSLSFSIQAAFGQKKQSLSGFVKDAETGEDLIGANVYIEEDEVGVATNVYGYYSISLEPGKYTLIASYVGYKDQRKKIELKSENQKVNFNLTEVGVETDEVVVTAERSDENVKSKEMSKIEIQAEQLKEIPVLFGETDVIKTIQLLPGIQSTGDGNSGFFVRGGGPDQNLILLDEAVVYNASHLFGFFSVFNADAIKNVSILKGGMPANYGGRLSSVLNVTLKDGNKQQFKANGGVGLISSRLMVEGPLVKDKGSFMIAGRRTYADVLAQPFLNESVRGNRYYFYDLNAKFNYTFNDNNRLYLSGYFGRDVFSFKDGNSLSNNPPQFGSDWGNSTVTLRWNHLFSDKLFSNTSLIYNDYNFEFGGGLSQLNFQFSSAIQDYGFKTDFDYFATSKTKIKFGASATRHKFNPGAINVDLAEQSVGFANPNRFALEMGTYALVDHDFSERFNINLGLRFSGFSALGPFTEAVFNELDQPTGDTIKYQEWENIKWYDEFEPRFAFRYIINETSSIKGSLTRNAQYLHLASISGGTLPTDLWLPSSKYIRPQIAIQGALGWFKNLKDNKYETSIEVFYKPLRNQIDFEPGANLFVAEDIDRTVLSGDGLAYGAEFFLKRTEGRLTGWIAYTWSKTTRTIPPLNNGNPYFPRFDRRHDVSILGTYRITDELKASAVWVFATGIAFTPTVGRFFGNIGLEGTDAQSIMPFFDVISVYPDEYNGERLVPYHRGDISLIYTPKSKKERDWKGEWNLSVFNVYNRKNPYFVYDDTDLSRGINERKMVYFPVIPSISYNFKF